MTDTSVEPTGWWEASMPDFSLPKEAAAPSVGSTHASDTWQWTTITGQGPSGVSSATSVTSASAPSNTTPPPHAEQANTSPGLPLINLPDPKKFAEWQARQNASETYPSKEY